MKSGLGRYLAEAFNARPLGMPVPPNWVGLAAFGLLGAVNPGFWLIGAGIEAAYLLGLSHMPRFRAVVDAKQLAEETAGSNERMAASAAMLDEARRRRFFSLKQRCDALLEEQGMETDSPIQRLQREGLDRLLAIHLRLLITQLAMERLLKGSDEDSESLKERARELREELEGKSLDEEYRRSLEGRVAILDRRAAALEQGGRQMAFSESELGRIEQQVALIGDEVRLSAAPEAIGSQIDRASVELDETRRWVNEQQRAFDTDVDVPWSQTQ
jgi:hypothetical protein